MDEINKTLEKAERGAAREYVKKQMEIHERWKAAHPRPKHKQKKEDASITGYDPDEEMKEIINCLNESGASQITPETAERLYAEFSEEVYSAGWMIASPFVLKAFTEWIEEKEKNKPLTQEAKLKKMLDLFDSWNLKEYIPLHTERAMFADYLLKNGVTMQEDAREGPLTLDELAQMEGEPVWVQSPGIPEYGRWAIVEGVSAADGDKILFLHDDFTCHEYGDVWLAYRNKQNAAPQN